ncbi:MAG: hypothetical protein R2795_08655 [Saprospiraceae bacterium]
MLDETGQLIRSSNDWRLGEGIVHGATHLVRDGNSLLLNFPEKGIAICDMQGHLSHWLALPAITDLSIADGNLLLHHPTQGYQLLHLATNDLQPLTYHTNAPCCVGGKTGFTL